MLIFLSSNTFCEQDFFRYFYDFECKFEVIRLKSHVLIASHQLVLILLSSIYWTVLFACLIDPEMLKRGRRDGRRRWRKNEKFHRLLIFSLALRCRWCHKMLFHEQKCQFWAWLNASFQSFFSFFLCSCLNIKSIQCGDTVEEGRRLTWWKILKKFFFFQEKH